MRDFDDLRRTTQSLLRHGLVIGVLSVVLSACSTTEIPPSPERAASVPAASLELFEGAVALENGEARPYDRGVVTVPLRRDQPGSATIEVEFFRFRRDADAPADAPPLVILQGGPGYEGLAPKLEDLGYFEARLARYLRITDVIVPGQRGFGSSTDTPCEPMRTLTIEEALVPETRQQAMRDAVDRCRADWQAKGLDLAAFNVVEAAADVADIVSLLGYDTVQLRAISFGAHWGIAFLRNHGEVVTRAILASLEGPDHTYDAPTEVLATLSRIAASAEASPTLASRIPEGGLIEAYRRLIARADAEPISVETTHPQTDEPVTVALDGDDLRQVFAGSRRFTTFRFRMVSWPLALLEMLEGDFEGAAGSHLWNLLGTNIPNGAYFGYDCGSGISDARGAVLRNDPGAALLGPTWERLDTYCEGWSDLGETFQGPFRTDVPTILVQGTWDIGTPYENAVALRPSFTNHHFVRVEGGSHGAIREAIEEVEGFRETMDHWLATGDWSQVPGEAILPPYAWRADDGRD